MGVRPTSIAASLVAVLLFAGCGGGGGDASSDATATTAGTSTSALSKAELIEKGDEICAEANTAVGEIKPGSPNADAHAADLYSGMIKSLKDLGPPQEPEAIYGELLRTAADATAAENELAAVTPESSSHERLVNEAENALGSFQYYAAEYGFKDCSEGPS